MNRARRLEFSNNVALSTLQPGDMRRSQIERSVGMRCRYGAVRPPCGVTGVNETSLYILSNCKGGSVYVPRPS